MVLLPFERRRLYVSSQSHKTSDPRYPLNPPGLAERPWQGQGNVYVTVGAKTWVIVQRIRSL